MVYLYYTHQTSEECPTKDPASNKNPVNRVSRFPMNGNTVDGTREEVLIDNIRSPNGNHQGGDLQFGKDSHLYISVGDGACDYAERNSCQSSNDASRDRHVLLGKILRIMSDGEIPADNPLRTGRSDCSGEGSRAPSTSTATTRAASR